MPESAIRAAAGRALGLLDLTSLNDDDDTQDIAELCARACTAYGPVAAVCILPQFVPQAVALLAGTGVRIATVVNFPDGAAGPNDVASQAALAVAAGAHEIDAVWDYRAWIRSDRARAQKVVVACRDAIGGRARLKVILETGAMGQAADAGAAALDAVAAGADIVKTSTGKIEVGATPDTVAAMLDALAGHRMHHIGLKAAGGIRTTADAICYLTLADRIMGPDWVSPTRFRFGASSLLDDLLHVLGGGKTERKSRKTGY